MSLFLSPETGQTITEPITLAAVKNRLKLTSTADDAQITGMITQAREFAERISRRSLAVKSYGYSMDRFPYPHEPIRVPMPPLISVSSIMYFDDTGTEQTLDPTEYWVAGQQIPALIAPAQGIVWPQTGRQPGSVLLTFTAGYNFPGQSTPTVIPAGPQLPAHWAANLVDICVFIYENAGVKIPESLVNIPKVFLF